MKNKTLRKILAFVMLTILLVQFALTIVVFAKDEESIEYTNAWNDLKASPLFNPTDYPQLPSSHEKYYSLEVITVAESENGELFVYVYQPSGESSGIRASSINIANVDRAMEDKDYSNYSLTYLNHHDVYYKYKVNGYTVPSSETVSIEISSIFRPWSEKYGDQKPGGDNTISEVAFPVGKLYTISGSSRSMTVEDIELIKVTEKYVGYVRYEQDTPLFAGIRDTAIDAHFVAISTDRRIDELLEADVAFYVQKFTNSVGFNWGEKIFQTKYLDYTQMAECEISDGSIWTHNEHIWKRIQKTEDFLKNDTPVYLFPGFSVDQDLPFTDEAREELKKTDWVLSFVETEYLFKVNGSQMIPTTETYSRVGDVTILRLKFKTDGVVYNLGVVDNKQTGSEDPSAVVEKQEWWQKVMMVLMLILLLVALIFIWPIISPVVKIIWQGIKGIFKFLIWILMLPSKLFRKIFKLSDQRADQRRKKGKVKK